MMKDSYRFILTSGFIIMPLLGGFALSQSMESKPTELVEWIIGPAGVLVLLLAMSYLLWKRVEKIQTKNDELHEKREKEQEEVIKRLRNKLDKESE